MVKKLLTVEDCLKIGKVLNPKTNRCNKAKSNPKPVKKSDKPPKAKSIDPVKTKLIKKVLTNEDCLKIGKILNKKTNRCNKARTVKTRRVSSSVLSVPKKSISPYKMSSSMIRRVDAFKKKER